MGEQRRRESEDDARRREEQRRQQEEEQARIWTAPITLIRPQGEAPAELVPGTLADGAAGFMLKDGVLPRAEAAAR